MKLKKSNCDETQKLKLLGNSKTQTVMKLKKSNCNEAQKLKWLRNLKNYTKKTPIVIKLKL